MEFEDEDGLDEPGPPLLPPDDRLWRHPSEVGAGAAGGGVPPTSSVAPDEAAGREPRPVTVATLSSAITALLIVGLFAAVGPVRTERVAETRVAPASEAGGASVVPDIAALADRLRPALVHLRTSGGGAGVGTAVVIRSDGVMLSAAHLVANATAVRATLADGTERMVRVVGIDHELGLAVLDLDGEGYPTALLGSATSLRAGEPAIAVGVPDDDSGATVTAGVIGGLGRHVDHDGRAYLDMIQIDRAFAPGCSGGAVLDGKGAMVAVAAMNVPVEGTTLGYAIPIDMAKLSAQQLLDHGKVSRVWLGIEGEDLGLRRSAELGVAGGVVVKRVKADSPAARAGLAAGDIIVAIDEEAVPTMAALVLALRTHQAGSQVTVDYLRRGDRASSTVLLTERPTAG